ncbi:MAG TPA: alpha/beta fold hydrolase [Polyangiaceae bacterium]|jgi:carboxylesterase
MSYPILPGAEPWSAAGSGERARIGILLVHGFTGSPASLRPLAGMLNARGFTIELVRLPGHGTHYRDMMPTRYADWLAEVERKVGELKQRVSKVVLLGLSMGGTLVLDAASSRSDLVAGVTAINAPILNREGFLVKIAPLLESVLPVAPASAAGLTRNDIAKPGVSEIAYGWVPTASGNSLVRELPRVRAQLARLACPALIAYSLADHSVPPDNSREILKILAGKDVSELVLERSYHVATLDYDLELIEERVAEFADRVGA